MESPMTKKLEELLNLPDSKEIIKDARQEEKRNTAVVQAEDTQRDIQELDKIASALPRVKGLGDLSRFRIRRYCTKSVK